MKNYTMCLALSLLILTSSNPVHANEGTVFKMSDLFTIAQARNDGFGSCCKDADNDGEFDKCKDSTFRGGVEVCAAGWILSSCSSSGKPNECTPAPD